MYTSNDLKLKFAFSMMIDMSLVVINVPPLSSATLNSFGSARLLAALYLDIVCEDYYKGFNHSTRKHELVEIKDFFHRPKKCLIP